MGNVYTAALALIDLLAAAGHALAVHGEGFQPASDLPGELDAALTAFCGEGGPWTGITARRALRALLVAEGRAARELLACPVACCRLPVPYTAALDRKGACAWFTTDERTYRDHERRLPVFIPRELQLAARAHELGRLAPASFDSWLRAKRGPRSWLLTPDVVGVSSHDSQPTTCTVGDVLDALGVELRSVVLAEPLAAMTGAA